MPLFSILVCTHDRAEVLQQTLEHLREQASCSGDGEIIVIDNASKDATEQVVRGFPSVRYVREGRLGLSFARNRALEVARGEWVIFIDDDVIPDEGWLRSYVDFLRTADDGCAFFGGRVHPHYECEPPRQLVEGVVHMQGVWGLAEPPSCDATIRTTGDFFPIGANFGGRRDEFLQTGFDTRFGRKGRRLDSCEETVLMHALVKRGRYGAWVKGASVRHRVTGERMQLRYIARFFQGMGRSHARCFGTRSRFDLLRLYTAFLRQSFRGATKGQLFPFIQRHYHWGMLMGSWTWR